jgi:predicted nucleotidyltransferase
MTALQRLKEEREAARRALRQDVRSRLHAALSRLLPGAKVIVFGSLTRDHDFSEFSDVDLALETEPDHLSVYQLTALLMEEMGRPVDVILLSESRFRERIRREGEEWILPV